jgi:hypothetical protein
MSEPAQQLGREETEDDALLRRPVIVVGAPRSGTTVLGGMLSRHLALAYLQEPRLIWRYGNDGKSDVLRRSDARPEVVAHIRREFAKQVREAGRERLLEKTPSNALRLEFVDAILPDCRFVHILRDGVQSVLSIRRFWQKHAGTVRATTVKKRLREMQFRQIPHYTGELFRRVLAGRGSRLAKPPLWGPRLPGMDDLVRDLDLLEVCALQWRWCVESACNFGRTLPQDRYLECRLEDLDEEMMRRILDFCELAPSEEVMANFRSRFDQKQTTSRASDGEPAEIEQIRQWIGPTLKWLGME